MTNSKTIVGENLETGETRVFKGVKEVADFLGMSYATVQTYVKKGEDYKGWNWRYKYETKGRGRVKYTNKPRSSKGVLPSGEAYCQCCSLPFKERDLLLVCQSCVVDTKNMKQYFSYLKEGLSRWFGGKK